MKISGAIPANSEHRHTLEQLGADLLALLEAARRKPMNPDTIVLIHGFWVTPRSWEHWKAHYEQQGYRVLTPAYPGFEVEVEALNADPTPIENLTVPAVIDHLTDVDRRDRAAADPDRPLRRRSVHPAHAGSRLRRSGRGDQLSSHRGRARGAAVAAQVHLPGTADDRAQEGCRVHPRAVSRRRFPASFPVTDLRLCTPMP
jgi:hypothetical protein